MNFTLTPSTVNMLFPISFVFLLAIGSGQAFFSLSIANSSIGNASLNVSCYFYQINSNVSYPSYRYCMLTIDADYVNGTHFTSWEYTGWSNVNPVRQWLSKRNCSGFSPSTPIGYGYCSSWPYQTGVNLTSYICICNTNACNSNTSTCEASVDAIRQQGAAPTQPPAIAPILNSSISCADYSLPTTYSWCNDRNFSLGFNGSACRDYYASQTVMCAAFYFFGFTSSIALTIRETDLALDTIVTLLTHNYLFVNVSASFFETNTSFLVAFSFQNFQICYCYCATNMCNINISTCTAGMNFDCTYTGINSTTNTAVNTTSLSTSKIRLIKTECLTENFVPC